MALKTTPGIPGYGFISRPEFQVFFNDTFSNDFNTLFNALPVNKLYMAAGVTGSFFGQLFPKEVPREVLLKDSRAWNKGEISYVRSSCELKKVFAA
ncbi:hypothetical protein DCAR_0935070 [Daucus carota subsp. sativus]|uniref:Uncharacterized protein n=1 Tax=Daucus carota subsp. sativus TaxID=79200 RepID=A0AAF1BDA6_DAUCS|nr:PREDICTED: gibberellic acid methyltransferase 1-like [Daucus carota subsp. sativus]WOH15529.1 hypothetical protein DCAR_0935070 [Daucus carota subsp. sativus]